MIGPVEFLAIDDLVTDLAQGLVREIHHVLAADDPALHLGGVSYHREERSHVIQLVTHFVYL